MRLRRIWRGESFVREHEALDGEQLVSPGFICSTGVRSSDPTRRGEFRPGRPFAFIQDRLGGLGADESHRFLLAPLQAGRLSPLALRKPHWLLRGYVDPPHLRFRHVLMPSPSSSPPPPRRPLPLPGPGSHSTGTPCCAEPPQPNGGDRRTRRRAGSNSSSTAARHHDRRPLRAPRHRPGIAIEPPGSAVADAERMGRRPQREDHRPRRHCPAKVEMAKAQMKRAGHDYEPATFTNGEHDFENLVKRDDIDSSTRPPRGSGTSRRPRRHERRQARGHRGPRRLHRRRLLEPRQHVGEDAAPLPHHGELLLRLQRDAGAQHGARRHLRRHHRRRRRLQPRPARHPERGQGRGALAPRAPHPAQRQLLSHPRTARSPTTWTSTAAIASSTWSR